MRTIGTSDTCLYKNYTGRSLPPPHEVFETCKSHVNMEKGICSCIIHSSEACFTCKRFYAVTCGHGNLTDVTS